jgi:hypothetical protein
LSCQSRSFPIGLNDPNGGERPWIILLASTYHCESSAICVVTQSGTVAREAKIACEPEALIAFLRAMDVSITGIGLESGPLSQWLHRHLCAAGLEAVLVETRQVKGAL